MCTAFISVDPASPVPVLVLSVRDEYLGRDWLPPAAHWPAHPGLVGGRDLLAGGTWLAVDPGTGAGRVPRMACLLNGFGAGPAPEVRVSRGELALLAVERGGLDARSLDRYDPFHLVLAEASEVRVLSWTGRELQDRVLPAGLHTVVNDGLEGEADNRTASERAAGMMAARIAHFRPRLAATRRPEPADGPTVDAWGGWLPLADGDGLAPDAPEALVQRRDFGDGRIWGTTSAALVALTPTGLRYDFNPTPGRDGWYRVDLPAAALPGPRPAPSSAPRSAGTGQDSVHCSGSA